MAHLLLFGQGSWWRMGLREGTGVMVEAVAGVGEGIKKDIRNYLQGAVVARVCNSSTREAETGRSLEFRANLVYRASFRTARAAQRNPVSKNQKRKRKRNCLLEPCLWLLGR